MEQLSPSWYMQRSPKGTDELATRGLNLGGKLRTILIMINAQQTIGELLDSIEFLEITMHDIETLYSLNLIMRTNQTRSISSLEADSENVSPQNQANKDDEIERFRSAYSIMTELVGKSLGIGGFFLQMKIERASSLDELRELSEPVLKAYKKRAEIKLYKFVSDQLALLFK